MPGREAAWRLHLATADLSSPLPVVPCHRRFYTTEIDMDVTLDVASQGARYADFYSSLREPVRWFRYDVAYRVRRMHEVLGELGVRCEEARVLDAGFGWGDMLASFPHSCRISGADISRSAVHRAVSDPALTRFASYDFRVISGADSEELPEGPFDVVISSHTLEHVPDDRAFLASMVRRLTPGGVAVLFVPVEEPDYCPIHLRTYSVQSLSQLAREAGLSLVHAEGNMHVEGHVWTILSIPTRRRWPVLRYVASGVRHTILSAFPYPALRAIDRTLFRLGVGARQAFVVARKP